MPTGQWSCESRKLALAVLFPGDISPSEHKSEDVRKATCINSFSLPTLNPLPSFRLSLHIVMFISTTLSSLTLGVALLSGANARLTARAASTITGPQINCTGYQNDGPYMSLYNATGGALPGFNTTYMLSDALKAAGSTTVPATDYQVLQNSGPFNGDDFQL